MIDKLESEKIKSLLLFVGFVDLMGVSFVVPALPIYARSLDLNNFEVGCLIAIFGACQMITSPFVGSWSDTVGSKFLLVLSIILTSISYFLLGLSDGLKLFIFARIMTGVCKHTGTLIVVYFSVLLPPREAMIAVGEYGAISNIGLIVGPVVGGMVADNENGFALVCFMAATIFISNAVLVLFAIPSIRKQSETSSGGGGMFDSLKTVNFNVLFNPLLLKFLVTFSIMLYRESFSLILKDKYQLDIKVSGYLLAFQATIVSIAGFSVGIFLQFSTLETLLVYTTVILFFCLVLLIVANSLIFLIFILVPFNYCYTILQVVTLEQMILVSKPEVTGAVTGLAQSSFAFAKTIAPIVSGILLDAQANGPAAGGAMVSLMAIVLAVAMLSQPVGAQSDSGKCETCQQITDYFKSIFDWT